MKSKDTFFSDKQSLNCRGRLIGFNPAIIMGILNITPDSFYEGSRVSTPEEIRKRAESMVMEGADIIDVGAYSSRPGSRGISPQEEMKRLETALPVIREVAPDIPLSVDTFRSEVAKRAVEDFGVDMINDISGGELDGEMFDTIADLGVPYTIMHMKGTPADMQKHANYENVLVEITSYLADRVEKLEKRGVIDIIIDPGFGFAKTIEHNFEILGKLEKFRVFRQPLMVGLSRKSMIYKTLSSEPADALNGTSVLHTIALMKGANILRVHDVKEAREAVLLLRKTL